MSEHPSAITTNEKTADCNINVAIRIRPLSEREKSISDDLSFNVHDDQIVTTIGSNAFTFDKIIGPEVTDNKVIFDAIAKPIVESTLVGFNGTIFAYGQTSAGKTFTMKGKEENLGIVPLALDHIFKHVQSAKYYDFNIRCSYLEIYNEVITDLLTNGNTNLKVHESLSSGIFVGNLSEEPVFSIEEAINLFNKGEERRQIGSTYVNEHSSRSHTIFRLIIESRETISHCGEVRESFENRTVTVSTLTFVDLAGSERVGQTGADGIRLKEGGHINKSLLALTSVISKLADGNDRAHIPYRDSKLTRILQPSLGGNGRCAIICALTPAIEFAEESLGTLKFASRAKSIKTKARVNEIISDKELLRRARVEILDLKNKLLSMEDSSFGSPKKRKYNDYRFLLGSLQKEVADLADDCGFSMKESGKTFEICKELWEELSFLKLEADTTRNTLVNLQTILSEKEDRMKALQSDNARLLLENEDIQRFKDINVDLQEKIHQIKDEMASVEEALMDDLARMNAENEQLIEENKSLKDYHAQKTCISCRQVESQIEIFSESLRALEEFIEASPKKSDIEALEISYQRKLDAITSEKSVLEAKLDISREEIVLRENDILGLMEKLGNIKKNERSIEESYENEISSLRIQIGQLQTTIKMLIEKEKSVEESAKTHQNMAENIGVRLQDAQIQLENTSVELRSAQNQIKALQENEHKLLGKISTMTSEEVNRLNTITDLQKKLIDVNHTLERNRNEESEYSQKIADLSRNNTCLTSLVEEKNVLLNELETKTTGFLEKIFLLEEKIHLLSKDNENFQLEIKNYIEKLFETENSLQESNMETDKLQQFWKAQLKSLQTDKDVEISALNSHIERLQELCSTLKQEKMEIETRLFTVNEAIIESRTERERLGVLLDRCNEQKLDLLEKIEEHEQTLLKKSVSKNNKAEELLVRIELEKSREIFGKEKRLLQLRISELEELNNDLQRNSILQVSDQKIDLNEKLKQLEEENYRLNQLYQASIHKIEYYTAIINSKVEVVVDSKENQPPREQQAFGR